MGLECGECEHDLRGGHHPSCSRYRPPARCAICDKQLVDGDGEEYCPTHGSVDAVYNFATEASMHEKAGGAGDQMTDYRIVKAMVEYCNGYTSHYAIGYMAERRLRLFGLHILWWPCINARWRRTAYDAQLDVRNDAELRKEMVKGNSRRIQ